MYVYNPTYFILIINREYEFALLYLKQVKKPKKYNPTIQQFFLKNNYLILIGTATDVRRFSISL